MAEETTHHCFPHPLRTFGLEAYLSLPIHLNPLSKIKWGWSKFSKIWEVFDETLGVLFCFVFLGNGHAFSLWYRLPVTEIPIN